LFLLEFWDLTITKDLPLSPPVMRTTIGSLFPLPDNFPPLNAILSRASSQEQLTGISKDFMGEIPWLSLQQGTAQSQLITEQFQFVVIELSNSVRNAIMADGTMILFPMHAEPTARPTNAVMESRIPMRNAMVRHGAHPSANKTDEDFVRMRTSGECAVVIDNLPSDSHKLAPLPEL
jgi:hypothetical protein